MLPPVFGLSRISELTTQPLLKERPFQGRRSFFILGFSDHSQWNHQFPGKVSPNRIPRFFGSAHLSAMQTGVEDTDKIEPLQSFSSPSGGIHAVKAIVTERLNRDRIEPPQPSFSTTSTPSPSRSPLQ